VLFPRRSTLLLVGFCLLPLASCANTPWAQSLQKSLEADPRLQAQASPAVLPVVTSSPDPGVSQSQLPADFPTAIPLYGDRELRSVKVEKSPAQASNPRPSSPGTSNPGTSNPGTSNPGTSSEVTTRWVSGDGSDRVLAFYLQQLQADKWQILERPTNPKQGAIVARLNALTLYVTVQPSLATTGKTSDNTLPATEFELRYTQRSGAIAQTPGSATLPGGTIVAGIEASKGLSRPNQFRDVDQVPKELRQYVEDLAKLGVLTAAPTAEQADSQSGDAKPGDAKPGDAKPGDAKPGDTKPGDSKPGDSKPGNPKPGDSQPNNFDPSAALSRREYARWLFATNNRLYATRPNLQLRPGSPSSQPAFQDVPRTDLDFAAIQGLAEAGIIASPLSGESTAVIFRPDSPLTREEMVLWKVPLDTHQPLPNATLEAVQQTWGFEDTGRIAPRALRAVLVDFQNADQSNIRRAFGYTTIFQPKKPVSRAQAAAALWHFGYQSDGISAQEVLRGGAAAKKGG
jgi:hypothetical protein